MKKLTGLEVLRLSMQKNDAEAATVGEYLVKLARAAWREGADFSGKRPFGNSGWDWEIYLALVKAEAVKGVIDNDGYLDTFDRTSADELVELAFKSLLIFVDPNQPAEGELGESEEIELVINEVGSTTITLNRAEYEKAKREQRLDHLLDPYISDMDSEITITEPNGVEFQH